MNKNIINLENIVSKTIKGSYENISTIELDNLAAETAAYMSIIHPDYSKLAARISVSNLHKETKNNFYEYIVSIKNYFNN